MKININRGLLVNSGFVNNDFDNIRAIKATEADKLLERKKIHANTVKVKVSNIEKKSLIFGKNFPLATISKFFLLVFKNIDGIINNAFSNPQIIKVQFAPCQNPLTTKIITVLRTLPKLPTYCLQVEYIGNP